MPPGCAQARTAGRIASGGCLLAAPGRRDSTTGIDPCGSRRIAAACCNGHRRERKARRMTTLAVVPDTGGVTPVLEGRGLTKSFWVKRSAGLLARRARLHAVDDVSVQLTAGSVTAVVGESGSGKTTVARLLARILSPDAGDVLLDGRV